MEKNINCHEIRDMVGSHSIVDKVSSMYLLFLLLPERKFIYTQRMLECNLTSPQDYSVFIHRDALRVQKWHGHVCSVWMFFQLWKYVSDLAETYLVLRGFLWFCPNKAVCRGEPRTIVATLFPALENEKIPNERNLPGCWVDPLNQACLWASDVHVFQKAWVSFQIVVQTRAL